MTIDERNDKVNETLENRLDGLGESIERAEQMLKEMRLLVDTGYTYAKWGDPNHPEYDEYASIGMVKLNGAWRLCHGLSDDCDPHPDWKPLRDATIYQRLQAIEALDKLREKIVEEKQKTIPRVESAIAKVVHILDSWQHGASTSEMPHEE